jgi:peptidoglycan/xylan/chitin deacetylase (PgdA/CDA1 family)
LLGVTRTMHGFRILLCGLVLILVLGSVCVGAAAVPLGMSHRPPARVPILVYHTVDESGNTYSITRRQLNQQCRWLVEHGYTSITLRQFWRAARGLTDLPPNPVILTNDDGDPSTRRFARILERYGLVGTYFVNNVSPLTRHQIRWLAQWGSVEAHTVSHVALSGLDYEGQVAEIAENRAYLEEITGQPTRFLAWPYGAVNESAIEAAEAAGIIVALGLGGTAANLDTTDWYTIPRIMIFVNDDLETFAAKVTGS